MDSLLSISYGSESDNKSFHRLGALHEGQMYRITRAVRTHELLLAGNKSGPCKRWEKLISLQGHQQAIRRLASESDSRPSDATKPGSEDETSPTGLTASSIMTLASNRATRFVYLRTLPLAQRNEFSGREEELGRQIESAAQGVVSRHLSKVIDDRAAVHVHTAALAVATKKVLGPYLGNGITLNNMVRAGFGAPLVPDKTTMSDEQLLVLNEDQKVRPDFWVVRFALWIAFDKMAAVRRMTENMVKDFGQTFVTVSKSDEVVGMPRHTLIVRKLSTANQSGRMFLNAAT